MNENAIDGLAIDELSLFFSGLIDETKKMYPDGQPNEKKAMLVHSSLSAFGVVPGAERSVTEALIRSCAGAELTLIMPAHGENDRSGKNCFAMGRIPEYFRQRRGTKRSAHPYLSFCAYGAHAGKILKNHRAQDGVGMNSPIGKLYRMDAIVLMLGTGYETCTVMHLAEYAEAERLRAENVVPDTVTCWSKGKSWEEPAFHPERFALIGEAFERENPGHVVTHTLPGKMSRQEMTQKNPSEREPAPRALARAMRIRALVDFSIDRYRYLR